MQKSENINITWMRACACIMVVILHLAEIPFPSSSNFFLRFLSVTNNSFFRIAAPSFAMISGYLFFSKGEEPSLGLAAKRFWSIFKIIIYFGTFYYLYDAINGRHYPYYVALTHETPSGWHLWYLYAILPIYTLSAYISLPRNKSQSFYWGFLMVILCLYFLTQGLTSHPLNIKTQYALYWLFLYMITGFILGQIKWGKAWLFFTAYLVLSTIICVLEYKSGQGYPYWSSHGSFQLFIQNILFFMAIMRLNTVEILGKSWGRGIHSVLSLVSKYSLGIYGWHLIFRFRSNYLWRSLGLTTQYILPLSFMTTFLGALLFSMADTWFWAKVRAWLTPLWQKISTCLQKKLPFPKNP